MSVKIFKKTLEHAKFKFNAMAFKAAEDNGNGANKIFAVMTHGYTASKQDCISWAQRLSDAGIHTVIFDQPGHYLGSYFDVASFEDFTNYAHECFISAFEFLSEHVGHKPKTLVLGGHSLGALMSLKAIEHEYFSEFDKLSICVGYGLNQSEDTHIFDTAFYEKTINIRRQLVSPAIDSDKMFPWIKSYKEEIDVSDKRIHLICGKDDLVVGKGGMAHLENVLAQKGNQVTSTEPNRLPHNNPELAASHIYSFLKKEFSL